MESLPIPSIYLIPAVAGLVILAAFILLWEPPARRRARTRLKRIAGKKKKRTLSTATQQMDLRRHTRAEKHHAITQTLGFIGRLDQRLETAGLEISAERYLCFSGGIGLAVMLLMAMSGKPVAVGLLSGIMMGIGLPHFYVSRRIGKHRKQLLGYFPDAIDLIVRGLRAGLPVAESMQSVAKEIPDPVGQVFREISEQIALGVTMEKALADMARKLRTREFDFFVISITLQRETGGNLGEILHNLSDVLRQRHIMRLKIKAMASEAKASAYIIGALPFLVFAALMFLSPGYMDPLFEDYRGNLAAGGALLSLGFGAFVMSRMVKFEI